MLQKSLVDEHILHLKERKNYCETIMLHIRIRPFSEQVQWTWARNVWLSQHLPWEGRDALHGVRMVHAPRKHVQNIISSFSVSPVATTSHFPCQLNPEQQKEDSRAVTPVPWFTFPSLPKSPEFPTGKCQANGDVFLPGMLGMWFQSSPCWEWKLFWSATLVPPGKFGIGLPEVQQKGEKKKKLAVCLFVCVSAVSNENQSRSYHYSFAMLWLAILSPQMTYNGRLFKTLLWCYL